MLKKLALLAAFAVAAAPALSAQTGTVKFVNGGSTNDGQYYVGPYSGQLNGSPVTLNCVDFFDHVNNGDVWTANITNLGTGTLSNTRLMRVVGDSYATALSTYEKAAFLTTLYAGKSSTDVIDIQHAIWAIMGASAENTGNASNWINFANTHYATSGVNYSNFTILTDVNQLGTDPHQEFIVTPEPSSLALLGTGIIGLVPLYRRRRGA